MVEIIYYPTIIYKDYAKESFDAIKKTEKGVITGRVINGNFYACGFIPNQNIKEIKR